MKLQDEERRQHIEDMTIQQDSAAEEGKVVTEHGRRSSVTDAVFGEVTEGGPNYRNVGHHVAGSGSTSTDNEHSSAGQAPRSL